MKSQLYSHRSAWRRSFGLAGLLVLAVIAGACAPQATPAVVETQAPIVHTQVVTQIVAGTPVETIIEVTPEPAGPTQGGTYITAYPGTGTGVTVGPFPEGSGLQVMNWRLAYNELAELDETWNEFVPGLAESWETSEDGTEVTFHLRPDVTWHDGEPFTADDVVFSVQAWLSVSDSTIGALPNMLVGGEEFFTGASDTLDSVVAVDDQTVTFSLTGPQPLFMLLVNSQPIMAQHQFEGQITQGMTLADLAELEAIQAPVGTGPFKITAYDPDASIEYEKNADYFRGEPLLDSIVLRLFTSETPIVTGLETGEIHSSALWSKGDYPRLGMLDQIRVWSDPAQAGWYRIVPNLRPERSDSPLADVRFRQALLYAIPRQTISDSLLLGISEPALSSINAPALLDGLELTDYSYNPDKARELLAEMGYDEATAPELTFIYIIPDESPVLAAIQQAAAEVGIKLNLRAIEGPARPEYYADPTSWDLLWSYQGAAADYGGHLATFMPCTLPLPECGYDGNKTWTPTERFTEIYEAQGTEADPEARRAMLQEAIVILDQELPILPMWTDPATYFINTRVHGAANGVYKYGFPVNYIGAETWWLDSAE